MRRPAPVAAGADRRQRRPPVRRRRPRPTAPAARRHAARRGARHAGLVGPDRRHAPPTATTRSPPRPPNGQRTEPLPQRPRRRPLADDRPDRRRPAHAGDPAVSRAAGPAADEPCRPAPGAPADAAGRSSAPPVAPRRRSLGAAGRTPSRRPPASPACRPRPRRRPGRRSPPTADARPRCRTTLAAALDMTAELPRVRPAEARPPPAHAGRRAAAQAAAAQRRAPMPAPAAAAPTRRWSCRSSGSSSRPGSAPAPAADATLPDEHAARPRAPTDDTTITAQFAAVEPHGYGGSRQARTPSTPQTAGDMVDRRAGRELGRTQRPRAPDPRRRPPYRPTWQTAADDGWRPPRPRPTAPVDDDHRRAGLPKRTPMAQLVPGGVDKGATSRAAPYAGGGAWSAVRVPPRCAAWPHPAQGRSTQSGLTTETGSNRQAGKEHEA